MKTLLRIGIVVVALLWVIMLNACSPAATPVLPTATSQPTPANTVAPTDMPTNTVAPAAVSYTHLTLPTSDLV